MEVGSLGSSNDTHVYEANSDQNVSANPQEVALEEQKGGYSSDQVAQLSHSYDISAGLSSESNQSSYEFARLAKGEVGAETTKDSFANEMSTRLAGVTQEYIDTYDKHGKFKRGDDLFVSRHEGDVLHAWRLSDNGKWLPATQKDLASLDRLIKEEQSQETPKTMDELAAKLKREEGLDIEDPKVKAKLFGVQNKALAEVAKTADGEGLMNNTFAAKMKAKLGFKLSTEEENTIKKLESETLDKALAHNPNEVVALAANELLSREDVDQSTIEGLAVLQDNINTPLTDRRDIAMYNKAFNRAYDEYSRLRSSSNLDKEQRRFVDDFHDFLEFSKNTAKPSLAGLDYLNSFEPYFQ